MCERRRRLGGFEAEREGAVGMMPSGEPPRDEPTPPEPAGRLQHHYTHARHAHPRHTQSRASAVTRLLSHVPPPSRVSSVTWLRSAGVDPGLFKRKDEKTRLKEAEAANAKWEAAKTAQLQAEEVAAEQKPWVGIPENVREVAALFPGQGTQKKGMADKLLADTGVAACARRMCG